MKKISPIYFLKRWLIGALAVLMTLSCTADIENLVGPSFSGYTIGVTAHYGGVGIVQSSGSATIRVEVVTAAGVPVNGATVFLTSTLGTLGAATFITVNGIAITTLTAGAVAGAAYIVATVENASATTMVPILSF
jgi:hypothetical protein|tara:strand:- start:544 stop:948 length:405 start_codon:yes stop_codon:yes gene_type:complete